MLEIQNLNSLNKKLSNKKKDLVSKIISFSEKNTKISAVLLTGSYLYDDPLESSDLSLLILYRDYSNIEIKNKLFQYLKLVNTHYLVFEDKIKLFEIKNGNSFKQIDKVSIYLINNFQGFKDSFSTNIMGNSSLDYLLLYINDPKFKVEIDNYFKSIPHFEIDTKIKLQQLINKFVELFDLGSIKGTLGDIYSFVFYFTEAYKILFSFDYLINNNEFFDLFNIDSIKKADISSRKNFFQTFFPEINIRSMNKYRRKYMDVFLDILPELIDRYELNIDTDSLKILLTNIVKRDYVWNFRDISNINSKKLITGKLYRSSVLARYKTENIFQEIIKTTGIKTIIDLRAPEEKNIHFYNSSLDKFGINYISFPLGQKEILKELELKYTNENDEHVFYELFPRYYKNEIKELFELLTKISYPAIIHCYAGRDRTGIIIAMLHKIFGLSNDEILKDYINSGLLAKKEFLKISFKVFEEYGGLNGYFQNIGLKNDVLNKLKIIFQK